MSEVRKLGGLQEVDGGRLVVIAIVAVAFAAGFLLGALLGYLWGQEDAATERIKQLYQQDKEKTT